MSSAAAPDRAAVFLRGPGLDFSERDRAVLTLLRPHLQQAYLKTERHRRPVPPLTSRQNDLLRLLAAGRGHGQDQRDLTARPSRAARACAAKRGFGAAYPVLLGG